MSEASNIVAIQPKQGLVGKFADKFGVDADKLLPALKQTAFRQSGNNEISNEQMMALLIVADQYGLNPWTKEIFAFPDKGAIIPVVSVDGWSRIINSNPAMDGIEFEYSPETITHSGKVCHVWIECLIYRKDRSRPIRVREFFAEVVRDMGPWKTHPCRMHRHKAEIQCARIAFGFAGIYDQDEAERIMENSRPEGTAPTLTQYTPEQKKHYDYLIAQSDAVEMYLFAQSIDEGQWESLYGSFEKGTKTKYKGIVSALYNEGQAMLNRIAQAVDEAAGRGDDTGVLENIQGLSPAALAHVSGLVSAETDQIIRLLQKAAEAEAQ